VPESISKLLAVAQAWAVAVLKTTRTHKWWWAGGGGVVLAGAIAAALVFGGFFGPSGKAICTATLDQAKDYGVIPTSASLASNSAKSTDVKDRRHCAAQVGDDNYDLLADVKSDDKACRKDLKGEDCVKLYSVARSDGMVTYQVREIPPDETDAAIAASENQQAASGGNPGGADNGAGNPTDIETETAVDNSGATQGSPAQSGPPQQ